MHTPTGYTNTRGHLITTNERGKAGRTWLASHGIRALPAGWAEARVRSTALHSPGSGWRGPWASLGGARRRSVQQSPHSSGLPGLCPSSSAWTARLGLRSHQTQGFSRSSSKTCPPAEHRAPRSPFQKPPCAFSICGEKVVCGQRRKDIGPRRQPTFMPEPLDITVLSLYVI